MKLSVIANPQKFGVKLAFERLVQWATHTSCHILVSEKLREFVPIGSSFEITQTELDAIRNSDAVLALGGDGTILYTARLLKYDPKPILGINSGRLGFMSFVPMEEMEIGLNGLIEGKLGSQRRYLWEARDNLGNMYHALNEFLFTKKGSASMITVEAWCDDEFVNKYWSDGLIIATPTGSTAYSLASSGPIVYPTTDVTLLTPINPHTLTTRPLVVPAEKVIKVVVREQQHEVLFSYDGEICEISKYPFQVEINKSGYSVELLELPGHSYFKTLQTKLMWGRDARD